MTRYYSTTLGDTKDILFFCGTTFIIAQIFCLMRRFFFTYLCGPVLESLHIKKPELQVKSRETLWFFIYYLFCVCLVTEFTLPNFKCWQQIGFHEDETLCPRPITLTIYCWGSVAFYLHALIVVFQEKRRKDFVVMVSHHVATVILITLGYCFSMYHMGGVIIGLHDFADMFLYFTKMLHYSKQADWIVTSSFVTFAITFFLTRIILFPMVVYWHYTFSSYGLGFSIVLYPLLIALYIMHVYWFWLIVKMIKKTLIQKKVEQDIRSDDEDED